MKSTVGIGDDTTQPLHFRLSHRSRLPHLVLACLTATALCLLGLALPVAAEELAKEDLACLKCHDNPGAAKTLGDGSKLSLHVSTGDFGTSMHKAIGCSACHSDIDLKTHAKEPVPFKDKRALSLTMKDTCRACHDKKATEYDDSVHAAAIAAGSDKAPFCADCHDPHKVRSMKEPVPMADVPCAKCHVDIFSAYSTSVHGKLRAATGSAGPICYDCHRAHDVKAASLGDGIKTACLGCHANAVDAHKEWLPNTARHFEAVSCAACHSPNAERRVNLRLYDVVGKQQVVEKTGVPRFERLVSASDIKNVGLDERALWSLLQGFNREGEDATTTLRGRLEVRHGAQAHQIHVKSEAIKDCNTCHAQGAAAFQSVSLTIAGPDGRPLRHGVQKGVLNSLTSMESVRGFYAIGATRIKLLDTLLVMVVLGALSVPIGHMTLKWMFRSVRAKVEAERLAATRQPGDGTVPGRGGDSTDRSGDPTRRDSDGTQRQERAP